MIKLERPGIQRARMSLSVTITVTPASAVAALKRISMTQTRRITYPSHCNDIILREDDIGPAVSTTKRTNE